MIFGINLRALAYLRRLTRAAESLAESQRTLAKLAESDWEEMHAPVKRKLASVASFDQDAVNKRYHEELEAQGVRLEDEG